MIKRKILVTALLSLGIGSTSQAATITNRITGVGPKNALINPYICIQDQNEQMTYALAYGATVDGNKYSGNDYYVGATIRFGGCGKDNAYLGYVGFSLNNQHNNRVSSYSPPAGVHIALTDSAINSEGVVTGTIKYTEIKPNFDLPIAGSNTDWPFVGINLSGLEFSKVIDPFVIPNLSLEDGQTANSDLAEMKSFIASGINTVRVPVRWAYLQLEGPGKGDINLDYYNSYVKPLLESLTNAHIHTIVDLHDYMRYAVFGKEYAGCGDEPVCPQGQLVLDSKAYQDIWGKLVALMKNDPKINMDYIMLDLMNEPVDVPGDYVFTIQADVIKSLRLQGYQGYILVEGNKWTGLHSWFDTWDNQNNSNAKLFSREHFAAAGIADLSKIVLNVHQYLDSNYSGTQDQCVTDLKTTGPDGFNLNAFSDYLQQNRMKAMVTEFGGGRDSATCQVAMTKFINYLKDNAAKDKDYGFIGWTAWSAGHGWGDYKLRITPNSYQMKVMQQYLQGK